MLLLLLLFVLTASTLTYAQDSNPAFVYECRAGVWALTFDDGPSPETERLLGYLDAAAIKVTFFIQGDKLSNASWAAQTKIAFEKGHQIASHTFSHPDLNTLTVAQIQQEMDTNAKLLKDLIGVTPHYMRPPFGNCDAQCADVMKQNQYVPVEWNVDSNDWKYDQLPDQRPLVLTNMQQNELLSQPVVNTSGYISLQHDTEFFSVDYVPEIIAKIKEQGFTFSTVQECIDNPPYPKYREIVTPSSNTTTTASSSPTSNPADPSGGNSSDDTGVSGSLAASASLASRSLKASLPMLALSLGTYTLLARF